MEGLWNIAVKSIDGALKFLSVVGFVVGSVVFAFSYRAFFTYYFNLCVGSNKRNKIMPTSTTELTATRKNIGKKVDQVTQLPTKGIGKEGFMKVLFLTLLRKSAKLHEILIVKKNLFFCEIS